MKKIIIGIFLLIAIGSIVGYKMYNKPHADIASAKPEVVLSAAELFRAYEENEITANEKHLGKIIEVSGKISQVNKTGGSVVSLGLETGDMMSGITCLLDEVNDNHRTDFSKGEEVRMRCVCTGRLMDIELNRCVEIN